MNDLNLPPPAAIADGAQQLVTLLNLLSEKGAAKLLADISKQAKAVQDAIAQLAKERTSFDEHQRAEHAKLEAASAAHARAVAEAREEHDQYIKQQRIDIDNEKKLAAELRRGAEDDKRQAAQDRAEMARRIRFYESGAAA